MLETHRAQPSKTMSDNKHQILVKSISTAVGTEIQPKLDALALQMGSEFSTIQVTLAALTARLEVLETMASSSGGGAKRAPRGGARTGGAKPAGNASDDPLDRVKNAMLFTRRMWSDDEKFRTKYRDEATVAAIEADEKVMKHAEGTEARYLAEGSLFWKKCATDQVKKDIRDEYGRWKEDRAKAAVAPPLPVDNGEPAA